VYSLKAAISVATIIIIVITCFVSGSIAGIIKHSKHKWETFLLYMTSSAHCLWTIAIKLMKKETADKYL